MSIGRHAYVSKMQKETKRSKTRLGDEPPPSAVHVPHLPEDLVVEMLTRLPSKSVLRFRAVSRAWRRITTDPAFLAAHARCRPLEILLCTTMTLRPWGHPDGYSRDTVVDTIPVPADQAGRRRLICYPYTIKGTSCKSLNLDWFYYSLVASSSHGVLLFKICTAAGGSTGTYHICNPVTRQWTELTRLPELNRSFVLEYGFYYHQPSGDFRLLIRCYVRTTMAYVHYILSTGATEPRVLSTAGVDEAAAVVIAALCRSYNYVAVAMHGRLHWLSPVSNMLRMVAFDTSSETFHLMTPPPTDVAVRTILFPMDGLMVAAEFGDMRIGLWFLEDYGAGSERWECQLQLANPPMLEKQLRAEDGTTWRNTLDIAIAGTDVERDIILGTIQGIVAYNVTTKMWRVIKAGDMHGMSSHIFRESLLQHQCFKARPSDCLPLIKFS